MSVTDIKGNTNRWHVTEYEECRDGDEDDAQLVLLALLLEEADLRAEDQGEEGGGMMCVLSRVSARCHCDLIIRCFALLVSFDAWQSGLLCSIAFKVINVEATDSPSLLFHSA